MHLCMVDPSRSWAQTLSLLSSCPWTSVFSVAGTWTHKHKDHSSTPVCTSTHVHTLVPKISLDPNSHPHCDFTLRDISASQTTSPTLWLLQLYLCWHSQTHSHSHLLQVMHRNLSSLVPPQWLSLVFTHFRLSRHGTSSLGSNPVGSIQNPYTLCLQSWVSYPGNC